MDFIIDFLVANYMWFLVITIILLFALVGYIVDSKEQKDLSVFDSPQELAKHLEKLAQAAQNKTIGEAVQSNQMPNFSNAPVNNTIEEVSNGPSSVAANANNGFYSQNQGMAVPPSYSSQPVNIQPVNNQPVINNQSVMQPVQNPVSSSQGLQQTEFEVLGK